MKKGIHPTLFKDAKTTCTMCGSVYAIPTTVKAQTVEVCRNCHPVYTGKKVTERRGGRIDRFKRRAEAAKGKKSK